MTIRVTKCVDIKLIGDIISRPTSSNPCLGYSALYERITLLSKLQNNYKCKIFVIK